MPSPFYGLLDITKHEGRLVVCGSFFINGATSIAYLEGGQWNILGSGILGGLSSIHAMAVYQGDLYVGGQISMSGGNAGRDIMRWDGNQFQPVGGGFRYAGGVPAYGVAGWDGTQWCGVPGNLSDGPGHLGVGQGGMAFYQDTLFVACGYLADGDSVHLAAKFVGTSYSDTCSGPVSVPLIEDPIRTLVRHDASAQELVVSATAHCDVTIVDAVGHVLGRRKGLTVRFSTVGWASGVYVVHISGQRSQRIVVP